VFFANASGPAEHYAALVGRYREQWAAHGRDAAEGLLLPADAAVNGVNGRSG
jgi:hypothetical protein